jgi:hypothetical protein
MKNSILSKLMFKIRRGKIPMPTVNPAEKMGTGDKKIGFIQCKYRFFFLFLHLS